MDNLIKCRWRGEHDGLFLVDAEAGYSIHIKCLEEACLCDTEEAEEIYHKVFGKKFWS